MGFPPWSRAWPLQFCMDSEKGRISMHAKQRPVQLVRVGGFTNIVLGSFLIASYHWFRDKTSLSKLTVTDWLVVGLSLLT